MFIQNLLRGGCRFLNNIDREIIFAFQFQPFPNNFVRAPPPPTTLHLRQLRPKNAKPDLPSYKATWTFSLLFKYFWSLPLLFYMSHTTRTEMQENTRARLRESRICQGASHAIYVSSCISVQDVLFSVNPPSRSRVTTKIWMSSSTRTSRRCQSSSGAPPPPTPRVSSSSTTTVTATNLWGERDTVSLSVC